MTKNWKGCEYPPIEESIEDIAIYRTVTEKYFAKRYCIDVGGKKGEDHCILFHSNRICLVTLAPHHPILSNKINIDKVNFQVSAKLDRMKNKVSGKGKHGAQYLQANSPLCRIECADGVSYTVSSCIKGKLVEVNENLLTNPALIATKPDAEGYIAIVLPSIQHSDEQKKTLLTEEQYNKIRSQVDAEQTLPNVASNGLDVVSVSAQDS